jgi:hypothetical protein
MISIILASILSAGTPLAAENSKSETTSTVQTVSNAYQLGSDVVAQTRADYESGKYNEFLNQMDKDYTRAKAENGLEGLIELRTESGKVNIHPEFYRSYEAIQDSKNENLLNVIGSDDSLFAQKVRSAASSVSADNKILRSLSFKAPGTGVNKDENAVIDIDLEFYYKGIHMDSLAAFGDSISDQKEKHLVLQMERMKQLVKASESFEDKELKKAIEQSSSNHQKLLAKMYDARDLLALSRGTIKPSSAIEEKIAAIVGNSQGQLAELHRHLLNTLDNPEPISETVQNS